METVGGSQPSAETSPAEFAVVGIGASAGGLESLEHLFGSLPSDSGMAFVVVQHLSPDFRSMMPELLARHTDMPVRMAEQEIAIEPNNVYLLPPGKEMTIKGRRLLLTDKERTPMLALPIDLFLRSLAEDVGPDAVAIILSGTGSDGSRGIKEVKRAGGRVVVESPETAKFDGMPMSAMATGVVDHAAAAGDIVRYLFPKAGDQDLPPQTVPEPEGEELPLASVFRLLRDQFGLDFSLYKTSTVTRRILRRIEMAGAKDLEAYVERLQSRPEELSLLYHDLLIGVTRFFRDPEAFDFLEKAVIPEILRRVPEREEIRVWVAGCATGEEPYSLAMMLFEQLTAAERRLNVKILATDVHAASLAHASRGLYQEEQLEHVNERRRERFFSKKPGGYQLSQDLRQLIVFAPHNVTKDAPFTKMHLISCRNLLIYLEPLAQRAVLSLFHFGLVTNGFLFLGSSETPGSLAQEFDVVHERWKVYRKRRDVRLLEPLKLPSARLGRPAAMPHLRSSIADSQLLNVYDQILDERMPPSFLVNENCQVVDSFGGVEKLFRFARRRPSTNILDLLEGDLRNIVAGAIQRALKREGAVRYTGVPIPDGNGTQRSVLSAKAFTTPATNVVHVLITLDPEVVNERREQTNDVPAGQLLNSAASQERLDTLEGELSYTRETLQSTIEELQTSNEELQASNEELVASNEELQSTNEELHSVNEELYSVNAELQRKIIELRELNNDMQHFLESTDSGTLFLDKQLRIRKYTRRIANIFRIEPQDVGRSIRHFSHSLKRSSLQAEIEDVLNGNSYEDEVRDAEGTTYFLRILPYRPANSDHTDPENAAIEGVVISLTDISALDRARSKLRHLSAIVESSDDAIIGTTLDGTIATWNRGAERLYGYRTGDVIGHNVSMLAPPGYADEMGGFLAALQRGERVEHIETMRVRNDGTPLDVSITMSPILDAEEQIVGASAIARDITQLRRIQKELMDRESRIRLLLDSTAEAILGLGADGLCTFSNPACARMLGYSSPEELIGRHLHPLLHSQFGNNPHSEKDCSLYTALRTGQGTHSENEVFARANGTAFPSEYWSYPVRDRGKIIGLVVTFIDITDRKRAEEEIRTSARRREEFLAMLSHELRNPLASVVSAATVMRSPGVHPEAIEKARLIVERQARHMARLLDDLLDVTRITRGGIELRKKDVDLCEVVKDAIDALTPLLVEHKTQIITRFANPLLHVRGDVDRLQQVVVNLLSNAIRYSPDAAAIHLYGAIEQDSVVIRVKDRGRGISPTMLSRIFDLFVQDDQGLERSSGGLGIGLTLVKKIVELHGGTVVAVSDGRGNGSEFIVRLPHQQMAVVRHPANPNMQDGSRRVLVVEDQDDAREMFHVLLSSQGHIVLQAADGAAALEMISRHHPDVALIDIGLPVMNGYEVCRKVRENPVFDDVVLIALTGYGMDSDVAAAEQAGFDRHLTKPADPAVIEELLLESRRRPRQAS